MIAADSVVIDKITALATPVTFSLKDTQGVEAQYTSKPVHEIKAAPPWLPKTVSVHTLEGFVDLIRERIEGLATDSLLNYYIQVDNHLAVTLNKKNSDSWGRRTCLIVGSPFEFAAFQFGKWLAQEEFCIAVAALFAETADKDYVLATASTLVSDSESIQNDNGFTQRATVKAGMKVPETVTLKGKVKLAPFRTFPECNQVISEFVFGARQTGTDPR